VDVVRDLLDKPVVDRNGREMGRVDGVVLDQRQGGPPRLSAVLIGPSVLGFRLHPTVGRWIAAFEYACGVDAGRPARLELGTIHIIERGVRADLAIGETAVDTVEQRIRARLIKIPGAQ
jgi:hypothetical protein